MNEIMWPRAKYWTEAFNPWVGCRKCSPACEHCYAEEFIKRFNMTGVECNGSFDPVRKDKYKTPKSGIVFAGNITDLFGEWVKGSESRQYVLDAAQAANGKKWCKYLFLTKRVRRMNELTKELGCYTFAKHYENVWFGFTAENQDCYYNRLSAYPSAENRWLSLEPLLGKIDLGFDRFKNTVGGVPFKWIVVGSESGRKRRPCDIELVRDIVRQCKGAGVPVFVKQISIDGKCVSDIYKFPEDLRIRQMPFDVPIDLFAKATPAWTL